MGILIKLNLVGNNDELNIAILNEKDENYDSNKTENLANFTISLKKISHSQTNDNNSSNQLLQNTIQEPPEENTIIDLTDESSDKNQDSPPEVIMGYYIVDKILGSRLNNRTNQHEFLLALKNCNSTDKSWNPPPDSQPVDFSAPDSVLYVRKSADLIDSELEPTPDLPEERMNESWNSVGIDDTTIKIQTEEYKPVITEESNVNIDPPIMTTEKPPENMKQELFHAVDDQSEIEGTKVLQMTEPTSVSKYACKNCGLSFDGPITLKKHLRNCKSEMFQCSYCPRLFTCEYHVKKHSRVHLNCTEFRCTMCGFTYGSSALLKNHEKQAHRVRYHRKYSRYSRIRMRFKKPNQKVPQFECQVCKRVFMRENALQMHACCHEGSQLLTCSCCNEFFVSEKMLKNHEQKTYQFPCSICGHKFKELWRLKMHEKLHVTKNLVPQFKCQVCKRIFFREKALKIHARCHGGVQCSRCKKFFDSEEELKSHELTVCLFVCFVCGKTFKELWRFKVHEMLHIEKNVVPLSSDASSSSNGSELFPCSHCDQKFVSKARGLVHIHLKHSDNSGKSVACLICGAVLLKVNLFYHMCRHTGETQKCELCDYKTIRSSILVKHVSSVHGVEIASTKNKTPNYTQSDT